MRLSRRQLYELLRHGEVVFGEDELRSVASMAEQVEKELAKMGQSAPAKKIGEIIFTTQEYRFTKFAGCYRKAIDKLHEARYWFERTKENAKQGK